MPNTRYLVVGGGMTADAAVKGIREHDADGPILLVGAEQHPPYKRPPLTKGLWSGADEASIWKHTSDAGADLILGRRIETIDLDARRATDDKGEEHEFEQLLLATGGTPRRLGGDDSEVIYFRTLDDYRRLRELAADGARVTVIGGGFIGSELAAGLTGAGAKVSMIFPEATIGGRIFPSALGQFVTDSYRGKAADVHTAQTVSSVGDVDADVVVAGLGIVPNTELAEQLGLPDDNGILVDEYGRARDGVFAAGDVASFPSAALGKRFRVEHEDHANTHGRVVGANMAGANKPYDHLPFFYSDLFDLGYEAVGDVDSRLATVETWTEPNRKGTVDYVDDDGRPRGFMVWIMCENVGAVSAL